MQEVCVQQVAISNYRIILILGFRGGWVNRRRDLRFHAYLRPTLELPSGSCGGRGEGSALSPQRALFTRVSFTIFVLSFRPSRFLFFSPFLLLSRSWMARNRNRARLVYRPRKPRFYSLALFSFFSFLLSSSTFRLKKFSLEWDVFNIEEINSSSLRIDRYYPSPCYFRHSFDRWNRILPLPLHNSVDLSKSKAPRFGAARLRPGYLVRWQAENSADRLNWSKNVAARLPSTREQAKRSSSLTLVPVTQLARPASPTLRTRDRRASSRSSSSRAILGRGRTRPPPVFFFFFFLFSLSFFFSNYNDWSIKLDWIRGGEGRGSFEFIVLSVLFNIFDDTFEAKFREIEGSLHNYKRYKRAMWRVLSRIIRIWWKFSLVERMTTERKFLKRLGNDRLGY